eukprot:CAMPEP_0201735912 /NCGR_PEP_ID=MMETSP0593-20130828/38304_1 /ASSEMBLY_ACC=CAM_ASM_000672 /TAXON_ID=267983 /ORGANISM="Skeletonema japonicum, Strain CCMP2506" /LENGTH=147 /DNA_ID=CAMNT_0048229551 /DNA_START=130 /DNA_END=570 /DNA_ORIENTATION=+
MSSPQQLLMSVLFFLAAVISSTSSFTANNVLLTRRRISVHSSSSIEQRRWQQSQQNNIIPTPKISSSSTILFTATSTPTINLQYDENDIINNPLKSAGLSFKSASTKSLGMLFYNIGGMDHKEIQALLLQGGTHLVNAGAAWTTDWD